LAAELNFTETPAYIFNLRIDEPVNILTDLSIATMCLIAFISIKKRQQDDSAVRYMNRYFIFLGLASVLGAFLGHGLLYMLSPRWKIAGWFSSMLAVTFAELAAIQLIRDQFSNRRIQIFQSLVILEFVLLSFIAFYSIDFHWVEAHSVFGLLLVFTGIHSFLFLHNKNKASLYFILSVAVLVVSIIIYGLELHLTSWMSFKYTSHLLITLSVWFSYKGVLNISPLVEENPE
jgi:hypothetical protein